MKCPTLALFIRIVHGLSETDALYTGIQWYLFWRISTGYRHRRHQWGMGDAPPKFKWG